VKETAGAVVESAIFEEEAKNKLVMAEREMEEIVEESTAVGEKFQEVNLELETERGHSQGLRDSTNS